jgi:RNA polymerase sigma-70 factor, ECF subfamily
LVPVERLAERPAPDDPVAAVLEAQSTRAALALLAELPPDLAEAVALRVLGGLEVAEVARIIGKRPGRCGSWPIGVYGGWPDGWRRLGWRRV